MTVMSFLAYPASGQWTAMLDAIRAMDGCQIVPSENKEVAIVVTEADNDKLAKDLQRQLESLDEVQCLAMCYGQSDYEGGAV